MPPKSFNYIQKQQLKDALQKQLELPVHVGGKTAFEFLGAAHFLPLGKDGDVWLFANDGKKLPSWFIKNSAERWKHKVGYITSRLFSLPLSSKLGLIEHDLGNYSVTISCKERAILELLHLVPSKQTLVDAKYLAEGLMTLRPNALQKLLECCRSIKVKRLFIFLADFCNLPCLEQLDLTKINLGKGKRRIGTGGCYIAKHLISIPETFVNTFIEEFEDSE